MRADRASAIGALAKPNTHVYSLFIPPKKLGESPKHAGTCTYPTQHTLVLSFQALTPIVTFCRFTASIDAINERLEQYADGRKQIEYLDCSQGFVEDNPKVRCLHLCQGLHICMFCAIKSHCLVHAHSMSCCNPCKSLTMCLNVCMHN